MSIRGYIATSADGFIADQNGQVDWLTPFQDVDFGYNAFISQIKTVVMGRKTYEHSMELGQGWPYPGQQGIVLTSTPIHNPPAQVSAWHNGIEKLVEHLHTQISGDCWIVGGAQLQTRLIELGALDRLELFIIPVFLGSGIPLYQSDKVQQTFDLQETQTFDRGIVKLDYRLKK